MIPHSIGRVIVGVDGSPGSLEALRHAVDLARLLHATLVPVLAWQAPGGETQAQQAQSPEYDREVERGARRRLRVAFEEGLGLLPADVPCKPLVVRGPTGRALLSAADRSDDLLVLGAGRRGAWGRISHGRIARYCIAHAVCPVLVVPPPPLAGVSRRLGRLTV
jgi:nucleotide-binding universal stress UspA family protein